MGLVALFVVVVAVTMLAHLFQWQLSAAARQAIKVDVPQSVLAYRVAAEAAQCRRFEKDFELCWDNPEDRGGTVVLWQSAYKKLEGSLDSLGALQQSGAGRQKLQQWRDQSKQYESRFLDVAQGVEEGRLATRSAVHQAMEGCQSTVQGLTAEAETFAAERISAVRASATAFEQAIASGSRLINLRAVVAVLTLILCVLWFSRNVLGRIRVLSEAVIRIASGDWKVRLECEGSDELDLLARQFNDMAAAIQTGHRQLNQAAEAAQTASQAKSEFLAGISDEIRVPVTVSLGYTEMLLGSLANPENLEVAGTIKRNNQYVLEVINDLRDLSRIEAGRLRLVPVSCSPHQIVAEVASQTRVRADAKGLSLSAEYEGPIPEQIRTDPARLRQILVNVVGNAIKFTEIGTIRLLTRFLDGQHGQPQLQFEVIDPGAGMTQRQMDRLFKPLAPDDSPLGDEFPATGLGLTISKRLLDMLGGTIDVDSTPGCGTTFTVTIPTGPLRGVRMIRQPGEAVAADEEKTAAASEPQARLDCRILLAEDGRENRRLLSFILEKAGARVAIAENGREALDKAMAAQKESDRQHDETPGPFDLILMDMQMPVMDGYDAARRLRQEGYAGRIIAVTGHSRDYDRQKCLSAGCDDYLTKPVDRQQLLEMVAKHVGRPAEEPSS